MANFGPEPQTNPLVCKNLSLKNRKNEIFSKGRVHGLGEKWTSLFVNIFIFRLFELLVFIA